jgi:uncharacterized protein YjbI with pentapeptide repeats
MTPQNSSDQKPQLGQRPTATRALTIAWIIFGTLLLLLVLVSIGGYLFPWDWTGIRKVADFSKRTLWEWLELLIVPFVLAAGGFLFTLYENRRVQEIAEERRQDDTQQSYLDQMGPLLLDQGKPLRESEEGAEVRTLARARTLAVLDALNGARKGWILQFLHDSELIGAGRFHDIRGWESIREAIIHLSSANLTRTSLPQASLVAADLKEVDLSGADLSHSELQIANLQHANLQEADLSRANLQHANLQEADLSGTNLQHANLPAASLERAHLCDADLRNADLQEASLQQADLEDANLQRANLEAANLDLAQLRGGELSKVILRGARMRSTDLRDANLRGATLVVADLTAANLQGAKLHDVNLQGAHLQGANLQDAVGVTYEQLAQEAASLVRATMPNGQTYEERLRDEEGRKEDDL